MAIELFQPMGAHLQDVTAHYANQHSAEIAELFRWPVYWAVVCWISLMGYQTLAGKLQEPFQNALWRAGCIVFLAGLAFEPSIYQVEILGLFDELQNGLVSTISGVETTPYKVADDMLSKAIDLGSETSTTISSLDPQTWLSAGVSAWIVWLGAGFIALESAGSIMVAKAALAIVLAFGQLAILLSIFPATRRVFDGFMELATGYIGKIALISAVMGFSMNLVTAALSKYDSSQVLYFPLILLLNVVVGYKLIKEIDGIATKLFGGITSVVSNPITAAARIATAPASGAANYLGQQTSRTSAKTGQQEIASRMSHLARGNTMLNPAYRQKAAENMKGGWGSASGGSAKSSKTGPTTLDRIRKADSERETKKGK